MFRVQRKAFGSTFNACHGVVRRMKPGHCEAVDRAEALSFLTAQKPIKLTLAETPFDALRLLLSTSSRLAWQAGNAEKGGIQ